MAREAGTIGKDVFPTGKDSFSIGPEPLQLATCLPDGEGLRDNREEGHSDGETLYPVSPTPPNGDPNAATNPCEDKRMGTGLGTTRRGMRPMA